MSIYIDDVRFSAQPLSQVDGASVPQSTFCGPMEIGGALYIALLDSQSPSATFALLVYKSTDDGTTWVLVSGTTQPGNIFFPWISVDSLGTNIWFLYASDISAGSGVALHVVAFDTATNLWGTPSNISASPAGTDLRAWGMTVQSDGTLNVVYTANVAAVFSVWLIRNIGSVWGSHVQLTAASWEQSGIFIDRNTNTTHLFIAPRDSGGAGPLVATNHLAIASDGTVGSQTQILPAPISANQFLYISFGQGCIWNDQIIVPYSRSAGGTGPNPVPAVFIGTPISSPVWSSVDLPYPPDPDGQFQNSIHNPHQCAAVVAGDLNVFWAALHWDIDFNILSGYLMQSVNTGSGFADATVFYDRSTDTSLSPPLSTHNGEAGVFNPSVGILSSGFGITFQEIANTTVGFGYNAQPNLYISGGVVPPTPLGITCGGSPGGEVGTFYSNVLPVTGGTPPYSYALIAGALPTSLQLDVNTGTISGTPSIAGTFTFTVQVTDSLGATAQVQCSITIANTLAISCGNPPSGIVGVGYQHTIPVSGGIPPYVLAIVNGALPTGLTLDPNTGIIVGIPTLAGTFTFTVSVSDSTATTANVVCSITISQVSIGCTQVQSGTVGVPYSQAFPATGGTPPYTFSVSAGQLPFGLTLDPVTGLLSGTPLVLGTYQVIVEVTDANGITATAICIHIIGCQ